MKKWNGWVFWLLLCIVVQLVVISISMAVAIHNPEHYDASSVAMAVLITLGIELLLSAVGMLIEAFEN